MITHPLCSLSLSICDYGFTAHWLCSTKKCDFCWSFNHQCLLCLVAKQKPTYANIVVSTRWLPMTPQLRNSTKHCIFIRKLWGMGDLIHKHGSVSDYSEPPTSSALHVLCNYSWSESQMTSDKLFTQQLLDKCLGLTWFILFLVYYFRVIPNPVTCILIFCVVYKSIVLVVVDNLLSFLTWDPLVDCNKYAFLYHTAFGILPPKEN